jgi:hypothetical protein
MLSKTSVTDIFRTFFSACVNQPLDMRKVYGRCPERGHFSVVTEAWYPESERTDGAFKLEKFPILP